MVRWRIFYADGSTYSNLDGSPWDASGYGVLGILRFDADNGRYILTQFDYYYYEPKLDDWFGTKEGGMWAYLGRPGPCRVLQGQWVDDLTYDNCVKRMLVDPDFPPKSARREGENV